MRKRKTAGRNLNGSGHVHCYLGTSVESGSSQRFERNIEADFEAYSTTNAWSNTDGMRIVFGGGDTDFQIDDLRLSNSMTKEFRCLQGGYTGQIVNRYTFEYGAPEKEVRWLHYDGVGNVLNYSDDSGDLASSTYQDAYGNVLSSITTGAWASTFDGRHLTTKEWDGDSELYYSFGRWYDCSNGIFITVEDLGGRRSSFPYDLSYDNPVRRADPSSYLPSGRKVSRQPTGSRSLTAALECKSVLRPGMVGSPLFGTENRSCQACAAKDAQGNIVLGDIEGLPGCKQCKITGSKGNDGRGGYGEHYFQACEDCMTVECLHVHPSLGDTAPPDSFLCMFLTMDGPCYIIEYYRRFNQEVEIDCGNGSCDVPCTEDCM